MILKKSKKAQHEIVGFVIIIIIVSIIGLIFLSFMIGRGEVKKTSAEVSNFLEASMYYTTDCAINFIPQYQDIQDLIKSCYENKRCLDKKNACEVLNETLRNIIDQSLKVDEQGVNKAYKLKIYYKEEDVLDDILSLENGNFNGCSSQIGGSYSIASGLSSGIINLELEVCKG